MNAFINIPTCTGSVEACRFDAISRVSPGDLDKSHSARAYVHIGETCFMTTLTQGEVLTLIEAATTTNAEETR
jgi:hypothetical protein